MSENSYTEVTTEGYGSRITNSLKGIIIGALFVLIGIGLLFWNEGNYVKTKQALEEAAGKTVEVTNINEVNAANQGQIVHMSGTAKTNEVLTDPVFGISHKGIMLQRKTEYYQWVQESRTETKKNLGGSETKETVYSYEQKWVSAPVDSSKFKEPAKYANKVAIPNAESMEMRASNVTFGAFTLSPRQIGLISNEKPYVIPEGTQLPANIAKQAKIESNMVYVHAPVIMAVANVTLSSGQTQGQTIMPANSTVTMGDSIPIIDPSTSVQRPASPQTGDMKITWSVIAPEEAISFVAQQNGQTFSPYIAGNKKEVLLLGMGTQTSAQLFATGHSSNSMLTWILRGVGFILIGIGLTSMMSILSVLADVVPFIGNLVGAATTFAAFVLAFVISISVIAVAWLFYRPLIGCSLLIIVILGIYYLRKMRKEAQAKTA